MQLAAAEVTERFAERGSRIAAALVAVQPELRAIGKDSINPHFRNRYASLDTIIETVRPILAAHGLAVTQSSEPMMDGKALSVRSLLLHESGEWLDAKAFVPLTKLDAQGAGGALTYGRRYSLAALLCLATDEDDDGQAASRPAKRAAKSHDESPPPPAAVSAPSKWMGAPADRPMPFGNTKGKPLGEHTTEHLTKIKQWCQQKNDPAFASIIKDIVSVIADRALGRDDDSAVDRMKREVETDELPF